MIGCIQAPTASTPEKIPLTDLGDGYKTFRRPPVMLFILCNL
jgi:hypothetical protein